MEVALNQLTQAQVAMHRPDLITKIQGMREQTLNEEIETEKAAQKELLADKTKLEAELEDLRAVNKTLKDAGDTASARDSIIKTIKTQGFVFGCGDEFDPNGNNKNSGSESDKDEILESIGKI